MLVGHDRNATGVDSEPTRALGDELTGLQLDGSLFLRAGYTEAWAYESLPPADAIAVLARGARQVVLFHLVAAGRCWIETHGADRHWASSGDVIVLPYNDRHRMGGRAGADIVCGYLSCDDPLFDPALRVFPPAFVVSPPPGPARDWVRASVDFTMQQTSRSPTRLLEVLLVEVLTLHLAGTPAADVGWFKAVQDPVLAPALQAIHRAPERRWTVSALAAQGHVSTSLLDERFRDLLGQPPIRYLAGWRMHVAQGLLRTTELGVATVARRVGYDSEVAFSRAFKRASGLAPSVWRVQRPR